MGRQRIDIEYPLTTKSPNIVWEQISSPHGLERWLADHVTEDNGVFTFTWGEPWTEQDVRRALLIEYVKYDHIKLQWEDDERDGIDAYWEMRIEKSDLTSHLNLIITDFAEDDDADGLRILWESNLDRLHRASGL
ncbi:MAG: SRPBCC domain-containing protein [Prevotella sp.]|nr:SRPBCC domain-containing protein [Prevotella sp.]